MTKKSKMKKDTYVAPVLTWQEHREYTVRNWTAQRDYAMAEVKKFAEKLTGTNPQYAMEWGQTAFTYAAKHTVFTVLLMLIEDEHATTADKFIEAARRYADDAIRDGLQQSSTSMASNEAKKRLGEEWLREVYGSWPKNGFERTALEMFPASADATDTSVMAGG